MKLFKIEQGQPVSVDTELPNTTLSMGREKFHLHAWSSDNLTVRLSSGGAWREQPSLRVRMHENLGHTLCKSLRLLSMCIDVIFKENSRICFALRSPEGEPRVLCLKTVSVTPNMQNFPNTLVDRTILYDDKQKITL